MLLNVLRKDLLLNARQFWGLLAWFGYVAYVLFREPQITSMTAGGSALVGALTASTICAREDKLRVAATLASLPVRRRTLVQGRYIVAFVAGAAMFVLVVAMAAVIPASSGHVARAVLPNSVLVSFSLAAMVVALLMPVVVRFGLLGVLVFLASFQVLGAVLFIALRLFGVRSAGRVFGAAERGIQAWHAALARPVPVLETAIVVAAGVWLSFRLSVFLAERQDL
jgi:ABC-type transport system involved in multi-copper enzyme maturation permease subunit